jgi:signal transduction histidine kinase
MNEPLTTADLASRGYTLFAAQQEIDSLIRHYVDELLTHHETAEAHVNTFKSVFESISEGLLVYDQQGKVVLANQKAMEIIGGDPTLWTAAHIYSRFRTFKIDGITPLTIDEFPSQIAFQGRNHSIEAILYGPNLRPEGMTLHLSAAPIKNERNEVIGVVSTFADISEKKRLERQRNTLATLIAHDLKNHLGAIDMTMAMLDSQLAGKLDAPMLEIIGDIKTTNHRFLDIANALLELYRTDLYELESSRISVDIAEIIRDAASMNSREAETAGVSIRLQIPKNVPRVNGIPAALRQAFHNLIQNGIEASKPGATIEVTVASTNTAVTVTVTDHGGGMSEETVSKILDRTRAASNVPTATGSTGFGLYLSRIIFEAHHSTISLHSQPGKGTTFTVNLPVSHG